MNKQKCPFCGKPMKQYIPTKGLFKGIKQPYSFVCTCPKFPAGMVLSRG